MKTNQLKRIISEEVKRAHEIQVLNEGVMDFLTSMFGNTADAIVDRLKNVLCQKVLGLFGVRANSLLSKAICNFFENLELAEVWRIFSGRENVCEGIVREMLEAVGETIVEEGAESLGLFPNSTLWPIAREMIENQLLHNSTLTTELSKKICSLDFAAILSGMGINRERADVVADTAERSGGAEPAVAAESLHEAARKIRRKK